MLERHQTKSSEQHLGNKSGSSLRHKRLPALPGWPWPRAWWRFARLVFDLLASPFGAAAATAEAGSRSGGEAKTYLTFALSLIPAKKPRPKSKWSMNDTDQLFATVEVRKCLQMRSSNRATAIHHTMLAT
ncbi:hypothetical protein IWW34DRAFT_791693 [Fusarium oxysporum f. sp. albedinis]|nr:hypothetical protein IWW34DRAFT_791693 [Fusarium oxysporum f. sp. albedinis]